MPVSDRLRQILPQPTITNNVVLYTGLFDIENPDSALLPDMTAQIYFVTSAARNVITVPVGALTFLEGGPASAGSGFNEIMANAGGRGRGGFNGSIPAGVQDGSNLPASTMPNAARQAGNRSSVLNDRSTSNLATVQVQLNDGTFETKEIIVGLTSRVSAEVISGLQVGEPVVSGVIQENVEGIDRNQLRSALGR